MQSSYVHHQYKQNPLKFLIKLMELNKFSSQLEKLDNAMYILTGIVTYRCLHHHDKQRINASVLQLKDIDGPLFSHLYGIIGFLSVNPYWFCWSLTDEELRNHFNLNDEASSALSYIGYDLKGLLTASGLAGFVLSLYKKGALDGVKSVAASATNYSLTKEIASTSNAAQSSIKNAAFSAAVVTVLASVLLATTTTNAKNAKKELILRGLLDMEAM